MSEPVTPESGWPLEDCLVHLDRAALWLFDHTNRSSRDGVIDFQWGHRRLWDRRPTSLESSKFLSGPVFSSFCTVNTLHGRPLKSPLVWPTPRSLVVPTDVTENRYRKGRLEGNEIGGSGTWKSRTVESLPNTRGPLTRIVETLSRINGKTKGVVTRDRTQFNRKDWQTWLPVVT